MTTHGCSATALILMSTSRLVCRVNASFMPIKITTTNCSLQTSSQQSDWFIYHAIVFQRRGQEYFTDATCVILLPSNIVCAIIASVIAFKLGKLSFLIGCNISQLNVVGVTDHFGGWMVPPFIRAWLQVSSIGCTCLLGYTFSSWLYAASLRVAPAQPSKVVLYEHY